MADYSDLGYEPAAKYADLGYVSAGDQPDVHKEAQGAVSRFLGTVWDQTGGAVGPTIRRVTGWDDWMKARDQMKAGDYTGAGATLISMASDPGHMGSDTLATSKDQLLRAGQAFQDKKDPQHLQRAVGHLNAAIPLVGTAFAGGMNGLDRMAKGEHAEGAAEVVSNLGMLALPGAVEEASARATPKAAAALKRVHPVVKAAVEAGAPDVAMGALKTGVGMAADAAGLPSHVGTYMGAREGVPQIARGVVKGFKAGRQAARDAAAPPPLPAEAAPYPGQTDPAAVQPRTPVFDTAVENTPTRTAAAQPEAPTPAAQPAPYPGQTDPAAVEPRTPAFDELPPAKKYTELGYEPAPAEAPAPGHSQQLLDDISQGMSGKPFQKLTTGEQAGVIRIADSLKPQGNPPASDAPQAAQTATPPATLYHGRQTPGQIDFQPGETYLTADPAEAAGFGSNVHQINVRPGSVKDVNPAIEQANINGDDLDEALSQEAEKARQEGHRFMSFYHPSAVGDKPDFQATVSLFPHEDLAPQGVASNVQPSGSSAAPVPSVSDQPAGGAAQPAPPADAAAPAGAAEQPKLLDEPAYERPTEPGAKPDYQAAARTVKARGLARFLTNPPEGPAITSEEASRMTPDQWQMIAREAGLAAKSAPSAETIRLAIDHMKEIEGRRAQRSLGTGTPDSGTPAAPDATLQANERPGATGQPIEAPTAGARGQGVPVQESSAPGGGSSAGATEVEIPGEGRSLPARYGLRELADVQSSHNGLTFQPNPKYSLVNDRDYTTQANQGKVIEGSGGKFKPAFHITDNPDAVNGPPVIDSKGNAIGGNGRTMQLQRVYAYNPKGAQAYRDLLTKKAAQFGIDPAAVATMKQPVLVREIADEHLGQASHAITDLNKTGTAALTPAERAIADSRRVSPATLDHIASKLDSLGPDGTLAKLLSSEDGPAIVEKLIKDGVLTSQETAAYITKDHKLTPAAKTRVSKLMLGRFFRDPAQLDQLPPAIATKLERLAAPVVKLEGSGAWNLTPKLQEALDLLDEARAHGTRNLSEFLKQTGLLGEARYTEDGVTLAKALQRFTGRELGQAIRDYAATAKFAAEHADAKAGLFGSDVKGEAPTPQEGFEAAFRPGKKSPSATPSTPAPTKPAKARRETAAEQLGDTLKGD